MSIHPPTPLHQLTSQPIPTSNILYNNKKGNDICQVQYQEFNLQETNFKIHNSLQLFKMITTTFIYIIKVYVQPLAAAIYIGPRKKNYLFPLTALKKVG